MTTRTALIVLAVAAVFVIAMALLSSSGRVDTSYAVALGGAAATAAAASRARRSAVERSAELARESADPPEALAGYDAERAAIEDRVAGMSEAERLAALRGES